MGGWDDIYKKDPKDYSYYDLGKPHKDLPKIVRRFKGVKNVLDIGCGSGRNFFYLTKHFQVEGIDIAKEGVRQIKKILPESRVKVGDIYNKLPYKTGVFDAIVGIQVLQHSTEPKIKKAISEIFRILKPGGWLFITVGGRISKGEVRYCLVKTAKKMAPNTYVPTKGSEKGLTHFIYSKKRLLDHFELFDIIETWKDDKDYYCLLARKPT
ncbi:class I SAM-dependent methyltransferase [Candidatus Woesearchaeota archaeon]|nr:class I SAM-dependent methyltransferase [Candidatus Woesearchaeota archaeon]